jgi:uncharacterized phage protein gp47/JayE
MAILSLRDFNTMVQTQAAAVQSSARALVDLTVGSVLRAILEANASVGLWMQWLTLLVLQTTRAATSVGSDLDTWVSDFSLTRQAAVAATGTLTLSRFTIGQTALAVPGLSAKTIDGTQQFTITTDITNAAWNAILGGYVIAANAVSITVPIQAVNAGIQGNVTASTITLLTAAIAGVDTVSNAAGLTNGIDAESDTALRTRFANYIQTRSLATTAAVGYAILSVQQGLSYTIQENVTPGGTYTPGTFVVTIDDGSGTPSTTLKASVALAINAVRPIGSVFTVQSPTDIIANITFTITAAAGYVKAALLGPAVAAVTAYINAIPLGAPLPLSRLLQVVYDSTPGISNVTLMLANAGTADLGGSPTQVVRAGTVVIS